MAQAPSRSAISNMFSSLFSGTSGMPKVETQVAQNKSGMPNNQNTQNPTTTENNDPNNKQTNQQTSQSPLDAFNDLFNNTASANPDEPPALSLDPNKLQEITSKMNFANSLPPELQQGLEQMGDQGKLILSLVDHVGRQAYSQALQHGSMLTNEFVGSRSEFDQKRVGSLVKKQLVNNSLSTGKDDHPVVRTLKGMIADQLQAKNPDATPDWINGQVQSFMTGLQQYGAPANQGGSSNEADQDVNWDEWINQSQAVEGQQATG